MINFTLWVKNFFSHLEILFFFLNPCYLNLWPFFSAYRLAFFWSFYIILPNCNKTGQELFMFFSTRYYKTSWTDRQINKQIERQTDWQTDIQTDKQSVHIPSIHNCDGRKTTSSETSKEQRLLQTLHKSIKIVSAPDFHDTQYDSGQYCSFLCSCLPHSPNWDGGVVVFFLSHDRASFL